MKERRIPFLKMSGAGNDFVVIDNRAGIVTTGKHAARELCDRKLIAADGLLLLEKGKKHEFRMRYFNRDGSEAEMCGNGGRCFARFISIVGRGQKKVVFEAMDGVHEARVDKASVSLRMSDSGFPRRGVSIELQGKSIKGEFINTGVPHFVVPVKDVEKIDVFELGRLARNHRAFKPQGANVDFIERLGGRKIRVRTYERGVEAETLGCGTGSVAAALVSFDMFGTGSPIRVLTESGVWLEVTFNDTSNGFADIWLTGDAKVLVEGNILL